MSSTTSPSTPGVPAPMASVWPPSNPSGTVIPFPLPWGQTGCCPPGGMDALMKCYCDIQAASAFIGQILIDQINNNPAVTEAIIAAIGKSGSSVPLLGVTNGAAAQPGQVGEFIQFASTQSVLIPAGGIQVFNLSMGVLQPGDWEIQCYIAVQAVVTLVAFGLNPVPAGFSSDTGGSLALTPLGEFQFIVGKPTQGLFAVPTLLPYQITLEGPASTAGTMEFYVTARRAR